MLQPPEQNTANLAMLQRGNPQSSSAILKRLYRDYIRAYRRSFVVALILMGIAAAMKAFFADSVQLIVDGMEEKRGFQYALWLALAVFGSFAVRGIANYFQTITMNKLGQRIVANIQRDMYDHVLEHDLAFVHANASGALASRIINDVGVMRTTVSEILLNSFRGGLEFIGLVGSMFYQDWRLSLLVFAVFPVSGFWVARMSKRLRKIAGNTQAATADFSALLNQTLQGIRHVKAYGNEAKEKSRVRTVTELIYKLSVKSVRLSAISGPLMEILSGLAAVLLIVFGYWQVEHGQNTPGNIMAFVAAFILAFDPMKRMGKVNGQFQSGLSAAERVFTLLDVKPTVIDRPGATPLDVADYGVNLDGVTFLYPDGTKALDDLSITVPHGKTIAIVGPSGAGKSTIINLIPRFYDVKEGRITVGGKDVRDVTRASLRAHIALVSQETALFDDTIRANIAYGKRDATPEEIEAAAVAAFADTFISGLPQGYDTIVGEHGVKLSGGQRQRIAIARAMLRNAPILLLDEATSALDNESERAVQAALKRLQQGRTTIVVAHRLSTIVDADQIIVLEHGTVAEQGTHAELLARRGTYARLYGLQAEIV